MLKMGICLIKKIKKKKRGKMDLIYIKNFKQKTQKLKSG